ncbi:hypothetical protein [Ruegeria conchae]|uniref:Uncharacterized protein n=1 Tax=Ruegeria conchae TaxID=981384 RepID=A0A497ZC26_9RHOB|nr:hypothetical protein [Ruegeria conchae]RLK02786.1 hypothetical protein CLV75_3338 [Ruegeria conchae]UWR03321.1 hypothetical protein K3740_01005 [Ruegeria conchae]
MSFIRPEAKLAMWRWREVLVAGFVLLLGLSWINGPGGLLGWLGWILVVVSIALAVIGLQRARFRTGAGGPGVVTIDEGQITYLGPLDGGIVAAREIERLALDPTARPALWVLDQPGQPTLHIPVNAEGAEALFDVFSNLPGLKTEQMLSELNGGSAHPVVIWERTPSRPAHLRLH